MEKSVENVLNQIQQDIKESLPKDFGKKQTITEVQDIMIKKTLEYINKHLGENHINIKPIETDEKNKTIRLEIIALDEVGIELLKRMEE